ncbi:MAG: hypothetical protein E6Q90_07005 [Actinobacteria bacterium]|nr:MAG: hypothetical protein E6Q90_07005 [Actinomycetota bacterium]
MGTPDEDRPDLIPLIDLELDEADEVMDAMSNVGLEAVPHRVDPGADEGRITRAVIRLYVPRAQLRDARSVVRGVLPEYAESGADAVRPETLPHSEEQQWADIVSGLRSDGFTEPSAPRLLPPDPPEEHFQAPEPEPMSRPSNAALLSWLGIVAGVLLVVVGMLTSGTGLIVLLGIGVFIGGFVGLVSRAGQHRDDDDYDDGAVV